MSTTKTAQNSGYRLGRWLQKGIDQVNRFELRVARRAQAGNPKYGYTLTRIVFLILKLAIIVGLFLVTSYVLFLLLAAGVMAWLLRGSDSSIFENDDKITTTDDYVDYGDVGNSDHYDVYPGHPIYDDD